MRTIRRSIAPLLLITLMGSGALTADAARPKTTLDRTITPEGERDLGYGAGESYLTRTLGWDDPGGKGKGLVGFKQLTDVHILDEESPGRVEYFDNCFPGVSAAYRPQEALTGQVGASMMKQLAGIVEGPGTGVPLTFAVSTGDNVDNVQYNELRWFIKLLDGGKVKPNSGDATYNAFTQEQTSTALETRILELAQKPFMSVGTKVPWYAVLGNHDGLVQGNAQINDTFQGLVVGNRKVFAKMEPYDDCPKDASEAANKALAAFLSKGRTVPADADRRFLTQAETIEEYFKTTGKPVGHGLAKAPTDPDLGSRAGYYSWKISPKVRGISLDTIAYSGGSNGALSDSQFKWLEQELTKWSTSFYGAASDGAPASNPAGKDRLIVLFSHHTSGTLTNPGSNTAEMPYHCFSTADVPDDSDTTCADGEGLGALIDRFPNVILWVNGHEHNNRVTPFESSNPDAPERGFWEINTAAHIDWPQQSRLIEIAWLPGFDGAGTVLVYGTLVDHSAAPDPSESTQSTQDFLASLSRVEAYYDACVRENQADCTAPGDPEDRNVRLVSKAPFDLSS
jgi:metallophosphoesterase (TIGR03767 family)